MVNYITVFLLLPVVMLVYDHTSVISFMRIVSEVTVEQWCSNMQQNKNKYSIIILVTVRYFLSKDLPRSGI
jgi:hypothetical protein